MTQVAASWLSEWEKLCWIGSVPVYIPPHFSQPPLRLSQRDFNVEAWEAGPPPSASVHDVWPPTYHAPVHLMPSSPFICQGEKDWHTYALLPIIGLGSVGIFELASFKKAEKKMSLCRINLFLYFVFVIFCFTQNNEKRGQIKCGGDVPDHHGIRCCCISICSPLVS